MLDLRWIRENPDELDRALARRGAAAQAAEIVTLDRDHRAIRTRLQEAQTERNRVSKEIGAAKRRGEAAAAQMAQVASLKTEMQELEERARARAAELDAFLLGLPNVPDAAAPDGADESSNRVVRTVGAARTFAFPPRDHVALGEGLGLIDFEAAARMSGARFVVLRGALARLERALAAFMLDLQTTEHGYTEMSVPLLVRDDALTGTGQLPKFAGDLFRTTAEHWLIPTGEVPLTNLVREQILAEDNLPLRVTAHTPCFRSEAGAAGKDTRGMIRQHQFTKVELVSVVAPEESAAELERMTSCAEEVLRRLELPYRVVELCAGDMGFGARRTYDLEVWLPAQDRYREISSCSDCGDFQARRMNARYRPVGDETGTRFVHTLNGSGLAVGRTLVAVLENYQNDDGTVTVPEALRPWMGGATVIGNNG
ncbi:MAG: serine--tRNA ligase [Proteobacteria bacterium]|nr:serine--tRNA ligase [Pseudomonadota bacterium]